MTAESDLMAASLQDCAVLELRHDQTISHISASWQQLTGHDAAEFINKPVSAIVQGTEADSLAFANAISQMQNQSFRVVFPSFRGTLEAQGVLTEGDLPIHSLWVVRPYQGQLGGAVSEELKKQVGTGGTQVLEAFFADLRAAVFENRTWYPAPRRVLCRICEAFVPDWWLERHTEFCTIEHTLESRIIEAHDRLVEHKVLLMQLALQGREYKGVAINRKRSFSLNQFAVRVSSPLATRRSSRASSNDPVEAVINELLEIVDTALALGELEQLDDAAEASASDESSDEADAPVLAPAPAHADANTSADTQADADASLATIQPNLHLSPPPDQYQPSPSLQSPDTGLFETHIKRIKDWAPPKTSQAGLGLLIKDTNAFIQAKANLVLRMSNYLALANKVLTEVEQLVNDQVELITIQVPTSSGGLASSATSIASVAVDDTDDDMDMPMYLYPPAEAPSPKLPAQASIPAIIKPSLIIPKDSPSNSPWQSPISSPRLAPLQNRRMSRSMSIASNRDRSISFASSEESIPRHTKSKPPGISDYEVISPISKGAFATVYLSRKKLTGEYFAMKCLKKSDVIEKNQATNVRSERAILITTADSPYVAKLYYTFQSREYLYMVMEYVNGGDCASLLRALTCLSEDWSRQYIAETITAVDSVHQQNIIHRDLKPDNLLIDSKGHLKLSDFGLSTKSAVNKHLHLEGETSSLVGTPDYMAPETINNEPQGQCTDWWAVGCMLFEFLYGIPPFNDETPEKVFSNILEGKINWPELPAEHDISSAAKDIITGLLTRDRSKRLGAGGVDEIKSHAFFKGLDWTRLYAQESSFTPKILRPDQTDYFDGRGATMQDFSSEASGGEYATASPDRRRFSSTATVSSGSSSRRASRLESGDEFGPFSYKNVGVLERQNHELISRIRTEADLLKPRRLSMSSPISSGGAAGTSGSGNASYWESAIHDSSPFASDNEESATRSAALVRVHRRRMERKSSSHALNSPRIVPDVLTCVSNPVWRYSMEKLLRDVGCQVVSCATGEETIRRGSSSVPFDLIFIDRNLSGGLQPPDIAQILHSTVNANSSTPIILVTPFAQESASLFAGHIEVPVTKAGLAEVLKTHCNWEVNQSAPGAQ